jgi:hypothetical protein
MSGLDESGVAFKRTQVVSVGSQADVAVGANREECASADPKVGSRGGLEVSDRVRDVGAGTEHYGGFKQRRIFYKSLQGGVEIQQCR